MQGWVGGRITNVCEDDPVKKLLTDRVLLCPMQGAAAAAASTDSDINSDPSTSDDD